MDAKEGLVIPVNISVASAAVDMPIFVVPDGAEYEVVEVTEDHAVAGNDGGAVTLDLKKASSGTSPSGGTSVLASTFNLKSTANTPVKKTAGNAGLSSVLATRTLRSGQILSLDFTGTLTTLAGLSVTVRLKMRRPPTLR